MVNKTPKRTKLIDSESFEMSDILTKRYGGINLYVVVMMLLSIGIIWTAVLTAEQTQQYHEDYMTLQKMKVNYRHLEIENQRLVIEQQTFSATPQIANRAVTHLGMYSPKNEDKLILQPMALLNDETNRESAASASALLIDPEAIRPEAIHPNDTTTTSTKGGSNE